MKATSKVDLYRNNPELAAGSVFYEAGQIDFFPEPTVIQPDNLFGIFHHEIDGPQRVVGQMPPDFHERLLAAVAASVRLTERHRRELLKRLCQADPSTSN